MNNDTIVYINVESDVDLFIRAVDLFGSEDLLTDESVRFFVARAVSYSNKNTDVDYLVGRVMDNIQKSIRQYYYKEQDTSEQERRIINAWTTMADSIKQTLQQHIYEGNNSKDKALALKSYSRTGELAVIVCDRESEWETYHGWRR